MHRVILRAKPGQIVDHINRDTLDNRRANLRIVTASQNNWNQRLLPAHNTSGYRGVSQVICHCVSRRYDEVKWQATINVKKRMIHLGYFASREAAAHAYDRAAKMYHEGFGMLNFP